MEAINTVLIPGLAVGATYGLIATAFSVLVRSTGIINFAHGALVMLGPAVVVVAAEKWGLPTAAAFALAIVAVLLASMIEERIAIRPFAQSGSALPWILSTLGVTVILEELLSIPFDGQPQGFSSYSISTEPIDVLGMRLSALTIGLIVAVVLTAYLLHLFYSRTRAGLMLQAIGEDLDGAIAIGISKRRMSQLAMLLSGVVALVTGWLLAPTALVNPGLGITYTFYGFVAAALGGLTSLRGAVIGGFVVGVVGQAASVWVGSLYANATLFAVLILVQLVRPHGLFGRPAVRAV